MPSFAAFLGVCLPRPANGTHNNISTHTLPGPCTQLLRQHHCMVLLPPAILTAAPDHKQRCAIRKPLRLYRLVKHASKGVHLQGW